MRARRLPTTSLVPMKGGLVVLTTEPPAGRPDVAAEPLARRADVAAEPLARRADVARTDHAAISVGTGGDGEGRQAVAIRPARESDESDFEGVLCVRGKAVDCGDDRDALAAEVPGWLATPAD